MTALNGEIDALDGKIAGKLQLELYAAVQDLLLDRLVWFLRNVDLTKGLAASVEHYRAGIADVSRRRSTARLPQEAPTRARRAASRAQRRRACRTHLARRIANLPALAAAPDIVLVADRTGRTVADVAATYFAASRYLPARPHRRTRRASIVVVGLFRPAGARPRARFDRRRRAPAHRRRWRATAQAGAAAVEAWISAAPGTRSSASARRCTRSPIPG